MRVKHVKKARKAIPSAGIEIGDEYYWWKFRYGSKQVSKDYPKRQQLTQSSFLISIWDIEDRISSLDPGNYFDIEALESERDEIISEIQSLKDDCESSLDNMPEHLKDSSPSGERLNNRIESLDEMINELEALDITDSDLGEPDEDDPDNEEGLIAELIESKVAEIQGVTYNGE